MTEILGVTLMLASALACAGVPGNELRCSYVSKVEGELSPYSDCGQLDEHGLRLAPKHLEALEFSEDGLGWVTTPGHAFYVKPSGQSVETVVYDERADYFSEGLARGLVDGKVGFINSDFEFEIPASYDFAFPFRKGHSVVCNGGVEVPEGEITFLKGGLWGVIDRSGRVMVPLEHHSKEALEESPAYKALNDACEKPPGATDPTR